MFLSYKRFFRLVFKTFFRSKGTYARLSPKRLLVMPGTILVLFLSQLIHWVGFFLDELLFPGYRNIEVKDPLFIVGVPRSGTTLFQRALAKDTAHFTGFTLWEMALAPSIIEWKFWTAVGKLDKLLGSLGHKLLRRLDRRIFRELSKMHPTSLFVHEEDELLLLPLFATVALMFPFPFPEDLLSFLRFDADLSADEQDRIMGFYKSCIQRHIYVHGRDKQYMAKNNLSATKLKSIRRVFPDARVICIVRSPYNTVPSIMSLATFYWKQFDNAGDVVELRDLLMTIAHHMYTHPMEVLPDWPEDVCAFVRYEDLKRDMPKTVANLYERLNLELDPAFAARLEEEHNRSKDFKSKHVYSMEEYSLTPEMILDSFGDVFEYFAFPTNYER